MNRQNDFDRALDSCLDRMARGEPVARCLADYPEFAPRLEPLLHVARISRDAGDFTPSVAAMAGARARLRVASARRGDIPAHRRQPGLLDRLLARPLPLAAIASFGVIALTILLVALPLSNHPAGVDPSTPVPTETALPPTTSPTTPTAEPSAPPSIPVPGEPDAPDMPDAPDGPVVTPDAVEVAPHPDGNFAFYVSDAPNDIADFLSLVITIESIELQPRGNAPWVRITPTEAQTDLVQLQGDLAHELWRGDAHEGDYAAVFIRVSEIVGVLEADGAGAEVVLPSDKLHISSGFSIQGDSPVDFVFDITVHRSRGAWGSPHYILVPQADESGVGRPLTAVTPRMPPHGVSAPGHNSEEGGAPADEDNRPENGAPRPGPGPAATHVWQETSVAAIP
jgi:hypothetical protein